MLKHTISKQTIVTTTALSLTIITRPENSQYVQDHTDWSGTQQGKSQPQTKASPKWYLQKLMSSSVQFVFNALVNGLFLLYTCYVCTVNRGISVVMCTSYYGYAIWKYDLFLKMRTTDTNKETVKMMCHDIVYMLKLKRRNKLKDPTCNS